MKSKEVLKFLNVSRTTLSRYVKEQKIRVIANANGFYDYNNFNIFKMREIVDRKKVAYCRVSTKKQAADLKKQIDFIKKYCNNNKVILDEIISEIGSGISMDRNKFSELLDQITSYQIEEIYISNNDRLLRSGFSVIKDLCSKFHTKIIVCENETIDPDKELLNEITSIIHCYSMKMYSSRRKKRLELIKESLDLDND